MLKALKIRVTTTTFLKQLFSFPPAQRWWRMFTNRQYYPHHGLCAVPSRLLLEFSDSRKPCETANASDIFIGGAFTLTSYRIRWGWILQQISLENWLAFKDLGAAFSPCATPSSSLWRFLSHPILYVSSYKTLQQRPAAPLFYLHPHYLRTVGYDSKLVFTSISSLCFYCRNCHIVLWLPIDVFISNVWL